MPISTVLLLFFISTGILFLIYLLKEKRQIRIIPSLLFWEESKTEPGGYRPRWHLESDPLFFLQLLILLLLCLALFNPHLFETFGRTDRDLILMIDRSASMQAHDISPDRFTEAQGKAIELVEDSRPGTEIAVITASIRPEVAVGFTDNHSDIIDHLSRLEPGDIPLDLESSFRLAEAVAAGREGVEVVFFTDGSFPEIPAVQFPLEIVQVGTSGENLGITGLHIRPAYGTRPVTYDLQLTIQNAGEKQRDTILTVSPIDRSGPAESRNLTIEPRSEKRVFFTFQPSEPTPYRFELDGGYLQVDNRAAAVIGPVEPFRILLLGEGNYFLERVLLSLPQTRIFSQTQASVEELQHFDLVVFDRVPVPVDFTGYGIYLDTAPPGWETGKRVEGMIQPLSWDQEAPMMRFINIEGLQITGLQTFTPPPGAESLVSAHEGPILMTFEDYERRGVVLSFDLTASNLPLQTSFPILFANILEWFFPRYFQPQNSLLRTGELFRESFPPGRRPQVIYSPTGEELPLLTLGNEIMLDQIERSGLYTIINQNEGRDYFTANLLSAAESDITPRIFSQKIAKSEAGTAEETVVVTSKNLWTYLALLVLMILFYEWYLYHRPVWKGR